MTDVSSYATASTTPGNNTSIKSVGIIGSSLLSTADDSFRNSMALAAQFYSDITAQDTVGGTGDTITVTTPTLYAAYAPIRLLFTASAANTTAVTLNLDGLGAKAVRKISGGTDVALVAGDIPAGARVDVVYSAAANSAAGGWVLIGSSGAYVPLAGGTMTGALVNSNTAAGISQFQAISTDAGAGSGPNFETFRDSASPAVSDALGVIWWYGRDSAANKQNYADMYGLIVSPTSGAESGALNFETIQAGANSLRFSIGAGLSSSAATGGDKGADTINVSNYYRNGVLANPGLVLLTSGSVAAAATLDIVLTAYTGYRGLRLLLSNWLPATGSTDLYLRFSTDGGSTYLTTNYMWADNRVAGGGTNNPAGASAAAQISLLSGGFSETTNSGIDVIIDIQGQTSTARYGKAAYRSAYSSAGAMQDISGSGAQATANDVDAIRLLFSSGNITSGTYALYGYL